MKKHLNWPEDDRICKLPDPVEGNDCIGCCPSKCPEKIDGYVWECIWKVGHDGNHCDIWCREWDERFKMIVYALCYQCHEPIKEHRGAFCNDVCRKAYGTR